MIGHCVITLKLCVVNPLLRCLKLSLREILKLIWNLIGPNVAFCPFLADTTWKWPGPIRVEWWCSDVAIWAWGTSGLWLCCASTPGTARWCPGTTIKYGGTVEQSDTNGVQHDAGNSTRGPWGRGWPGTPTWSTWFPETIIWKSACFAAAGCRRGKPYFCTSNTPAWWPAYYFVPR